MCVTKTPTRGGATFEPTASPPRPNVLAMDYSQQRHSTAASVDSTSKWTSAVLEPWTRNTTRSEVAPHAGEPPNPRMWSEKTPSNVQLPEVDWLRPSTPRYRGGSREPPRRRRFPWAVPDYFAPPQASSSAIAASSTVRTDPAPFSDAAAVRAATSALAPSPQRRARIARCLPGPDSIPTTGGVH